jgi:1,4-alpha-glucan branching enzyme
MGGEFGQSREWSHDRALDWELLQYPVHRGVQSWLRDLNHLYRSQPALHEQELESFGFEWVDCNDAPRSIISLLRRGKNPHDVVLVACNFTPVPREDYRVGVPVGGYWKELLNSDGKEYAGSGIGNGGGVTAERKPQHGRDFSLKLTLPPLAAVFFKPE